ncbi:hypothetical protein [Nocardia sp. 852002-20019_SCH5090214]|uniref:hypothetical protein n=1 Tax=Nocardia sp. 852002-20019_SCH5090214 TaxID=1834087 RepID=UPI000A85BF08|nr:hypothetical protein [Nocardia sp. 852002-20019_SCH5090214]
MERIHDAPRWQARGELLVNLDLPYGLHVRSVLMVIHTFVCEVDRSPRRQSANA